MPIFLQAQLVPIPSAVIRNVMRELPRLASQGSKVLLAPDTILGTNLRYRGLLEGLDLIGILDRDIEKHGKNISGLQVYPYEAAKTLAADAILITSMRFHNEIHTELLQQEPPLSAIVIDLCDGFTLGAYRHEVVERLTALTYVNHLLDLAPLLPQSERLVTTMLHGQTHTNKGETRDVEARIPEHWGFGDKLCALSAAREFARRNPELRVHFNLIPAVVNAYGDCLVRPGRNATLLPENSEAFHREKHYSIAGNYLGCYYLGLGLDFDANPNLDLPKVPPPDGLPPGHYIVLQPKANWAKPNLDTATLQRVIDQCPLPVVLAGKPGSGEGLRNISREYLGDEVGMLQLIRHAALVVTPRSASSHIAAGYRVPTVVWVPDDGENWHLDYPDWPHSIIPVQTEGIDDVILDHVKGLLQQQQSD